MTAVWIALAAAGLAVVATVILVGVAARRRELLTRIAQLERMHDRLTVERQRTTEAANLN